ncbi:MAG: class B sortase [Oscillospiraceae bacterium]|nr:class B sortase [Oscillospiraceae bacterium]
MSEEFKNSENLGGEQPGKKPFSVNIPEDDFVNDIPAPESDVPTDNKPHKVVRFVDNAPQKENEEKPVKKKGGFLGEFISGAAAGAKTVGEGISAGIKTVSEMKPKTEKKTAEPKAETEAVVSEPENIAENVDEASFPEKEKKQSALMSKINALPTSTVIIGAAVLLVLLVAIILLGATSCSSSGDEPSKPSNPGNITIDPENPTDPSQGESVSDILDFPDRTELFAEAFNANNDVVAWLYIPGLEDIDAGVCFSYDKSYPYDKRDITGKKVPNSYWIDGAYYTHYRGAFGDTAEELSKNTVIFGHSDLGLTNLSYQNDDPTGPLFSQLFNFKDPSFAEKTPFIYLTLPGEDTVWEIFSVFYNDAKATNSLFSPYYKKNGGSLWYIEPSPSDGEYQLMLDTITERSLYDYGVEVTAADRILTLSTCTVGYGLNSRSNYRFVVVAKLVTDPAVEHVERNASITINADAPVPGTYKEEFAEYAASWKPSEQ